MEAANNSCESQTLYSSMFCETTFSIFTKIIDKYSTLIENPQLDLHMCGTLQSARLAGMDVAKLAKMFLTK